MSTSSIFITRSNDAYAALGVIPPDQRWFAFDVPMASARFGRASQFAMAIWNYHSADEAGKVVREWGLVRDLDTGVHWYRVPRDKEGQHPNNRKSLWEALHIAARQGMPMQALLKDRLTRLCAPSFVFPITDVKLDLEGTTLWLEIGVPGDDAGTNVELRQTPPLMNLLGQTDKPRSPKLTEAQYVAACELADMVSQGQEERTVAIRALETEHGITPSTASVLLNNYRCMLEGQTFKAPMSADAMRVFADRIVSRHPSLLSNVIVSLEGYVAYAASQWNSPSTLVRDLLADLQADANRAEHLGQLDVVASTIIEGDKPNVPFGPSELLREIWVRGPQHRAFRNQLQRRWKKACSVHGVECNGQLRASHIVAWRLDEELRGDVNNGLLLSVPLDNLFDQGFISFSDEGFLLRSQQLKAETVQHFGLRPGLRIQWEQLHPVAVQAMRKNLARHRASHSQLHVYEEFGSESLGSYN